MQGLTYLLIYALLWKIGCKSCLLANAGVERFADERLLSELARKSCLSLIIAGVERFDN